MLRATVRIISSDAQPGDQVSGRKAQQLQRCHASVCRGLQKPEVLADLAGLPAFALVRFAQVPQICHFT
jgi:hypothetical protein